MDDIAILTNNITRLNSLWNDLADKAQKTFQEINNALKQVGDTLADSVKNAIVLKDTFAGIGADLEIKVEFEKLKKVKKTAEELEETLKKIAEKKYEIAIDAPRLSKSIQEVYKNSHIYHAVEKTNKKYNDIKKKAEHYIGTAAKNAGVKWSNSKAGKFVSKGIVSHSPATVHRVVQAARTAKRVGSFSAGIIKDGISDIGSFASVLNPASLLLKAGKTGFEKFKHAGEAGKLNGSLGDFYAKGNELVQGMGTSGAKVFDQLGPTFKNLLDIGEGFSKIIPKMIAAVQPLTTAINAIPLKEIFWPVIQFLPPVIGLVSKFAGLLITVLSPVIRSLAPLIQPVLYVLLSIGNVLMSALSPALKFVSSLLSWLGDHIASILTPILEKISKIFSGLAKHISGVVHAIKGFAGIEDIPEKIKETESLTSDTNARTADNAVQLSALFSQDAMKNMPSAVPNKSKGMELTEEAGQNSTPGHSSSGTTININTPLIGTFNIQAQRMNESYDKVKQEILQVLLDVFNRAAPAH